MTKQFMTLAAVLCCALTTVFFSCTTETIEEGGTPKDNTPVVSSTMNSKVYTNSETLKAFDFFVKYYDANGEIQNKKVTWTDIKENVKNDFSTRLDKEWSIEVTTGLPSTLGFWIDAKPRTDVEFNDPEQLYELRIAGTCTIYSSRESGNKYKEASDDNNSTAHISAKRFEKRFASDLPFINILCTFDKNGDLTKSKWE